MSELYTIDEIPYNAVQWSDQQRTSNSESLAQTKSAQVSPEADLFQGAPLKKGGKKSIKEN